MITPQTYANPIYDYRPGPDPFAAPRGRYAVAVVGAGPVGLCAAIDLAQRGIDTLLIDDDNTVSVGSRAICFAKRTLEILDRLGCAERATAKGVRWQLGRVFFRDQQIYEFDLQPEDRHKQPGFINLQQYYLEQYLVERAASLQRLELRWRSRVTGLRQSAGAVELDVETPDGVYPVRADYVIAADGARSALRELLGIPFAGRNFRDRFLIADVVMKADFPPERWFWFEPPFFDGQSALLHRQPDDVWRVDFQLGWDADPEQEKKSENVIPKIKALFGDERPFELEWVSVYSFSCLRMDRFVHDRVVFAGDAAHVVSPFGARGCNGGIQDADNLAWKLALVVNGLSPPSLLDSYDRERGLACDENLRNSSRSTDFMTPKNAVSRAFRDATLELAETQPFARRLVNSGRLSQPARLDGSALNTADRDGDGWRGEMAPGAPCADAPLQHAERGDGWLLNQLGDGFCALYFVDPDDERDLAAEFAALATLPIPIHTRTVTILADATVGVDGLIDTDGLINRRYDGRPGSYYLIRPDQHVAARWRRFEPRQVRGALARATANAPPRDAGARR